jgi:hypothetical protein
MCHNGHRVSEKLAQRKIERAPHPPYSPDINQCDFWLFPILKHNMKDREFQSQKGILKDIAKSSADLTFADVQSVFEEWMERPTLVVGNNGEYSPNSRHQFRKWLTFQEIGRRSGLLLPLSLSRI